MFVPGKRALRMDRCAAVVAVALASMSCAFEKSGTGSTDELAADSAADSTLADTTVVDVDSSADTFVPDAFVPDTSVPDTFVPDTFLADTLEAAIDTHVPFCDATDATLIGCYRFEGNGKDHSSYGNDLTLVAPSYVPGVDGQALAFGATTRATLADNSSLAVTSQLTIELWVRMRTLPTGSARMGLVDDDGRFGLFVYPPGTARAQSPAPLDTATNLPLSTWTHVAYTFDGETMTMFLNGKVSSTVGATGTFGPGSGSGLAVGGNSPSGDIVDGDIDSLRLFRIARTPKQICEAAGASGC